MRVVFRFDSSPASGMGHLMRCLALAEVLSIRGVELFFIGSEETCKAILHYRKNATCFTLPPGLSEHDDATSCIALLRGHDQVTPDWLIVDHYKLGKAWENIMKTHVASILAIDDLAREHACDILLDTLFTDEPRYAGKVPKECTLLLGPKYALLRGSFAKAKKQPAGSEPRIFLCFGGSDPVSATKWAAEALPKNIPIDIVAGYSYREKDALAEAAKKHANWHIFIDHPNPEFLMRRATIAIGAGGTMSWERAAMELPSIVISIADNQRAGCKTLAAEGVISYLGDFGKVTKDELCDAANALLADAKQRAHMVEVGRNIIDIYGAQRVADTILPPRFAIRRLRMEDAYAVLTGRNSEAVRHVMINDQIIAREDHMRWMESRVGNDETPYYIFLHESVPIGLVGLVRFDAEKNVGEWGFYIWDEDAPKGSGSHMLAAFLDEMLVRRSMHAIKAEAFSDNERSINLHRNLGFFDQGIIKNRVVRDGKNIDAPQFLLTAEVWRKRRSFFGDLLKQVVFLPNLA